MYSMAKSDPSAVLERRLQGIQLRVLRAHELLVRLLQVGLLDVCLLQVAREGVVP